MAQIDSSLVIDLNDLDLKLITDLDNILDHGRVAPTVNQILAHIGNTPFDLIDYSKSKGMLVEAYSPVAHGAVLDNADLRAMAARC